MASFKEIQQPTRSLVHRPSAPSNNAAASGALAAARASHSRNASHAVLTGALNNTGHRVGRRKSMTSQGANRVAMVAALKEAAVAMPTALPIAIDSAPTSLRHSGPRAGLARSGGVRSLPSPPPSLPLPSSALPKLEPVVDKDMIMASAIDDEAADANGISGAEGDDVRLDKSRARRASEGQPLAKEGGRKFNRPELHCEQCGKGYKHSSCLAKHLWEHTPEWSYTSKLLISKHQQVLLLEAASVLVGMTSKSDAANRAVSPPDSTMDAYSYQESLSPAASAPYSEEQQDSSSVETTPPPPDLPELSNSYTFPKMEAFKLARPFQSALSASSLAQSMPSAHAHTRQPSQEQRPPSSGLAGMGKEDGELAAAVENLSCSFQSGGWGLINAPLPDSSLMDSYLGLPSRAPESNIRQCLGEERDAAMPADRGSARMDDTRGSDAEVDSWWMSRSEAHDGTMFPMD